MSQIVYKIPRVTDKQIDAALKKLAREFGSFGVTIQIGNVSAEQVIYPEANDPKLLALLKQECDLIFHFSTNHQIF